MSTTMTITQNVSGGRFVGRGDRTITLTTTTDVITDYGDDAPRAVVDGINNVPLRARDLDDLIENLRTLRRAL